MYELEQEVVMKVKGIVHEASYPRNCDFCLSQIKRGELFAYSTDWNGEEEMVNCVSCVTELEK